MMNERQDGNFDEALLAAARDLPAEVTPERDLWPAIENAIALPGTSGRSRWNTVWAQAAAVVVEAPGRLLLRCAFEYERQSPRWEFSSSAGSERLAPGRGRR